MPKDSTMFYGAKPEIFEIAKVLRNHMTKAEKLLWEELKNNKINGLKFRRQHPINQFIVDFYCHKKKLVIELDGKIHLKQEQKERDEGRQYMIEKFGLNVVRFKNEEVFTKINQVVNTIKSYCNN